MSEVFGNVAVAEHGDQSGAVTRDVRYGAVDGSIHELRIAFDDGSSRVAHVEEVEGAGFSIWALAYEGGVWPTQVEALRSGEVVARRATTGMSRPEA